MESAKRTRPLGRRVWAIGAIVLALCLGGVLWAGGAAGPSLGQLMGLQQNVEGGPSTDDGGEALADPAVDNEDEEQPAPEPLTVLAPPASPLGDAAEAEDVVDEVILTLVEAQNEVLQRADGGVEGIEDIAAGFVKGEIEALAAERAQLGFVQVGEIQIVSVEETDVDLGADPPSTQLRVCIDASGLDILDAAGNSQKALMYNPEGPVLHIYGAQYLDGRWKIATHEIPENSECTDPTARN